MFFYKDANIRIFKTYTKIIYFYKINIIYDFIIILLFIFY